MTRTLRLTDLSLRQMFGLLALLSLLTLPALAAQAAEPPAAAPKDKFAEMDKNNDGKVVLEEFTAAFPGMREEAFKSIDKNGDGVVVREEWEVFSRQHASGMKPGNMPPAMQKGAPMNNMPGDPVIPPPDSADMPLLTPPNGR